MSGDRLGGFWHWLKARPWLAIVLVAMAVGVSLLDVLLPLTRQPTSLELALIRSISLALSLVGAYVFGRASAKEAAEAMIRPHARSALRRVLWLYGSLSRLGAWIAKYQEADPSPGKYDTLEAVVTEQLGTANDALEDWRDLVPDEVAEVEARLRSIQLSRLEADNE